MLDRCISALFRWMRCRHAMIDVIHFSNQNDNLKKMPVNLFLHV